MESGHRGPGVKACGQEPARRRLQGNCTMWRMGEMRSGERRRNIVVPDERHQRRKVLAELGEKPLFDRGFAGLVFCRTAAEARIGPTFKDFRAREHRNLGGCLSADPRSWSGSLSDGNEMNISGATVSSSGSFHNDAPGSQDS